MQKNCAHCGASLSESAKFCHRCGTPRGGAASGPASGPSPAGATANTVLPWVVAAIALLCLLAFIVGQNWRAAQPAPVAAPIASGPTNAPGRAVDISSMSPDERADRLFNRVMTYVTEGKSDSVLFFSPMAIQAFEALAPLTPHRRYDLGLLGVVSGDAAMARAQADTVLAAQPTHLLGLILAMRAAGLRQDGAARRAYHERFLTALTAERAKRLPEYLDHQSDIDAAVRDADGRAGAPTTPIPPVR